MTSTILHVRPTDEGVREIIRASFPHYRGKNVKIIVSETFRFFGTLWDEGYKREYVILRLSDMQSLRIDEAPFLGDSALYDVEHIIPSEYVIVVHVYAGVRESLEIIAPPSSIVTQLQAPSDLTENETIVLLAIRCLKSSYGGVSNYRFIEAHRRYGISQATWDQVKIDLFARGYLDRRGAITVEGKNAIVGKYW